MEQSGCVIDGVNKPLQVQILPLHLERIVNFQNMLI